MSNYERFIATKLLTETWLTANHADLVGLTEADLAERADAADLHVRVISRDGHGLALTADRSPNRINVALVEGRVSRVDGAY